MAAKLNKLEISQLRKLQQDPVWDVVERMLAGRIDSLKREEIAGQSAFQELRQLHRNQGGIMHLRKFFEDLEQGAFDDDE